ncbi:MAG: hypothetical protein Kow00122_13830 [Thermoleophilia bacterium]
MDTLHTDLARLLAETLSQEPGLRFARLFGSRADSRARPDSDVDLAVLLAPEAVGTGRGPVLRRLEEVLYERFPGLIFHVVDLATAPPLLQVEIMTHGMTLVPGRAGLEEELRLKALKLFFDTAPLYALRRAKLGALAARQVS